MKYLITHKVTKLFIFCLTVFSYQTLLGQSKDCKDGDNFFTKGNYRQAIDAYKKGDASCYYLKYAKAVAAKEFSYSYDSEQKEAVERLEKFLTSSIITPAMKDSVYYYLGLYCKTGKGVEQSDTKAIEYFEKAKNNIPQANLELVRLYEKNKSEYYPPRYLDSIAYSDKLTQDEKVEIMYRLGDHYMVQARKKEEKERNLDKALKWYNEANQNNINNVFKDKINDSIMVVLSSSFQREVVLRDNKKRPLANKEVCIAGKPNIPTNANGKCVLEFTMREKMDINPLIKLSIKGYDTVQYNLTEPNTLYFTSNSFWKKLISTDNEPYTRLNLKVGWGGNKIAFDASRDIKCGWGNSWNVELNMNFGKKIPFFKKSPLFVGLGFQHHSFPFSKIDKAYYENLSYNSIHMAFGWKYQIPKLRFVYLNIQTNYAFNFGTSYTNLLLDYEWKDNKITNLFHFQLLVGLTLMKKSWGGIEFNYCLTPSILNTNYEQTINDIKFEPFLTLSSTSHSLLLNLIIYIPGIK